MAIKRGLYLKEEKRLSYAIVLLKDNNHELKSTQNLTKFVSVIDEKNVLGRGINKGVMSNHKNAVSSTNHSLLASKECLVKADMQFK